MTDLQERSVAYPLAETLRRLRAHVEERDLKAQELAAETALPVAVVQALLEGGDPPATTVEERVCSRIKMLSDARLDRNPGKRLGDLVSEVSARLDISDVWARKLLRGEKMPNVTLLHGIADFFGVEGGEAFFTASPDEALNRVLEQRLSTYETPTTDPVQALMEKYGVVGTDMRLHGTALTPEQLEALLAGVIKSVMPTQGDTSR